MKDLTKVNEALTGVIAAHVALINEMRQLHYCLNIRQSEADFLSQKIAQLELELDGYRYRLAVIEKEMNNF